MTKKLINVALVGKTNAGKSTLINNVVGEKISIVNKKINTTLESIKGVCNKDKTQIIFYDTPGLNLLKTKDINNKKLRIELWQTLYDVDIILFLLDVSNYKYHETIKEIEKINEVKKPIILVFNKIDLINQKNIFPYIKELNHNNIIIDFFKISAKFTKGIDILIDYLVSKSTLKKWKFYQNEISDKDEIFITNECTRNAILKYLHKEVPYNIKIKNTNFKLLKNKNIKISQSIEISNIRYKPIILGKKGNTIKIIRESSQREISEILNATVHLYLKVNFINV